MAVRVRARFRAILGLGLKTDSTQGVLRFGLGLRQQIEVQIELELGLQIELKPSIGPVQGFGFRRSITEFYLTFCHAKYTRVRLRLAWHEGPHVTGLAYHEGQAPTCSVH